MNIIIKRRSIDWDKSLKKDTMQFCTKFMIGETELQIIESFIFASTGI